MIIPLVQVLLVDFFSWIIIYLCWPDRCNDDTCVFQIVNALQTSPGSCSLIGTDHFNCYSLQNLPQTFTQNLTTILHSTRVSTPESHSIWVSKITTPTTTSSTNFQASLCILQRSLYLQLEPFTHNTRPTT